MKLEILSPDKRIYSGDADALQLPGKDGLFGILKNHAPMISSLKKGMVKVSVNGKDELFEINGGVVEVQSNKVIVLAE
ncbi:MAG: ATP synthase F1 subunit epsilon [Salibacteraceae bacterium]